MIFDDPNTSWVTQILSIHQDEGCTNSAVIYSNITIIRVGYLGVCQPQERGHTIVNSFDSGIVLQFSAQVIKFTI